VKKTAVAGDVTSPDSPPALIAEDMKKTYRLRDVTFRVNPKGEQGFRVANRAHLGCLTDF
jgi:hypothetical protein